VVYFFTYNITAVEAALYQGSSKIQKLLELVIQMKFLEVKHSLQLFVSHVSGTRLIAEGGDGVSQGLLNEGVMAGDAILPFIPLHLTAIERSPDLLDWLKSWTGLRGQRLELPSHQDWFELGHDIRGWTHP
jgi:hypothetical protein